ncbi:MAG: NlpC/P60 family protein [Streptosporangiaceae bacterium]
MKRKMSALAGLVMATVVALPATAHADPDPIKQLRTIHDQLETLGEQVNGLKVRLKQAQRAASVATDNATRQQKALEVVQKRVGTLASTTYMNSGSDAAMSFATSPDPQVFLDQSATLSYFAAQDGTQALTLIDAMQAAQRSKKSADGRSQQVKSLKTELDSKVKKLKTDYTKLRDKVVKKNPANITKIPAIPGAGKAADALRAALTKLGDPYVWGADGPTSFDCSGLTMWAYAQVGINLPHFTGSQWNAGTHVSRAELQPGDLVFFYSDLHHVGMYIGNGMMVHAPQTGDVVRIVPMGDRPLAGGVRLA